MHQVRYFLAVARTLNFTRAAEECHVSQPSLTKAIQKLEEELGGLLFRRERGLTHLTELGRLMLPHLEQTYTAALAAKSLADGLRRAELAPLRLGLTDSIFLPELSTLLGEMGRALPGLRLDLTHAPQGDLVEAALRGDLDVLILSGTTSLPERLILRPLRGETARLLLPADHPLAGAGAVPRAALAGLVLLRRQGCPDTEALLEECSGCGMMLDVRHCGRSEVDLQQMVLSRLGLALSWQDTPRLPGLAAVDLIDAGGRHITLATVAGRQHSQAVDAFLRLVRSRSWDREPRPSALLEGAA